MRRAHVCGGGCLTCNDLAASNCRRGEAVAINKVKKRQRLKVSLATWPSKDNYGTRCWRSGEGRGGEGETGYLCHHPPSLPSSHSAEVIHFRKSSLRVALHRRFSHLVWVHTKQRGVPLSSWRHFVIRSFIYVYIYIYLVCYIGGIEQIFFFQ